MDRLELINDFALNTAEVIDGCCDLKVVTTGTLSAFGLPDELFQEEVDTNNLAKFGPGGRRREDGKWVKPPNHKPPDIAGLLKRLEDGK
jgi:predicted HAD superfamily Cof-like phosphohydrolase